MEVPDKPVIVYSRSRGLLSLRENDNDPVDVVRTTDGLLPLAVFRIDVGQWHVGFSGEMRPMSDVELEREGAFAGCIRDSTYTPVSDRETAEAWLSRLCESVIGGDGPTGSPEAS